MKAMLIETFLLIEMVLFWSVSLPVLALCFCGFAAWEKAAALVPGGPVGPAGTGPSPVFA